ncbi:MAG: hypothetical protein LBJ12_00085 [Oscillospiraceae bacterium]|nr:hypothetical protein [Oscillospiraceae bacterium]
MSISGDGVHQIAMSTAAHLKHRSVQRIIAHDGVGVGFVNADNSCLRALRYVDGRIAYSLVLSRVGEGNIMRAGIEEEAVGSRLFLDGISQAIALY